MIRVQKIQKQLPDSLNVAIHYYSILNLLNNWKLTHKEIQLIAFTCIKGNISSGGAKGQFINTFKSSKASLGNFIHKLYTLGYLVKENDKISLHPKLIFSFDKPIIIQLTICIE